LIFQTSKTGDSNQIKRNCKTKNSFVQLLIEKEYGSPVGHGTSRNIGGKQKLRRKREVFAEFSTVVFL
jgi:hypothetical protein